MRARVAVIALMGLLPSRAANADALDFDLQPGVSVKLDYIPSKNTEADGRRTARMVWTHHCQQAENLKSCDPGNRHEISLTILGKTCFAIIHGPQYPDKQGEEGIYQCYTTAKGEQFVGGATEFGLQ